MAAGEVFTLTYQVKIHNLVTAGIYPDLAYATAWFGDERIVFDNIHLASSIDDPFVNTQVEVIQRILCQLPTH